MLILKIFVSVIAIILLVYIFFNYLKKGDKKVNHEYSARELETIENLAEYETERREYISFRLLGGKVPKVWEFELTPRITIIGRGTEKFQNEKSIQGDRAFSREHLSFYKDRDGVVHFTAIKGERNPVYILEKDYGEVAIARTEKGSFYLEPDRAHVILMGNTKMEVFYRGSSVIASSDRRSNHKKAADGTRVYEIPGHDRGKNKRSGTRVFHGIS